MIFTKLYAANSWDSVAKTQRGRQQLFLFLLLVV